MSTNNVYSKFKEAKLDITKLKISLGAINPSRVSKNVLLNNTQDVKDKMLETISKLETTINASVKSNIQNYVKIENTLQDNTKRDKNKKLVLVNTYDKFAKKRAPDISTLKLTHTIPVSTNNRDHLRKFSRIWGNPKKIDNHPKFLENIIPKDVRLGNVDNQTTRDFLIKTIDNEKPNTMSRNKTVTNFYNQQFINTRNNFTSAISTARDFVSNNDTFDKNLSLTMRNSDFNSNKLGSTTYRETSKNFNSTKDLLSMRSTKGKLFFGRTTKPRRILSKEARKNPFFDMQILGDEDLNSGLLNLINQGLIPKDLDVGPVIDRDNPILNTQKIECDKFKDHETTVENMHLTNTFLITRPCEFFKELGLETKIHTKTKGFESHDELSYDSNQNKSDFNRQLDQTNPEINLGSEPEIDNKDINTDPNAQTNSPFTNFKTNFDVKEFMYSINKLYLYVEDTKIITTDNNYIAFKTQSFYMWGDIKMVLRRIKKLIKENGIQKVKIECRKVVDIAKRMHLPSEKTLLDCQDARDLIGHIIRKKFDKNDDRTLTMYALRLQGSWKAMLARKYLNTVKLMKTNFMCLQNWMKVKLFYKMTKKKILNITKGYQQTFDLIQNKFKDQWPIIKNERRIEIHINSLGYDKFKRETTANFVNKQNLQFSRFYRLKDPNLEIVYITASEAPVEMIQYTLKMLEIAGIKDAGKRIHIQTPEFAKQFNKIDLCLSAIVYYSTNILSKLTNLTNGKYSYIVNGYPSNYDQLLATKIGVPIQCGDPNQNYSYSTQNMTKLLIDEINFPKMPHTDQIIEEKQISSEFAELILENMDNHKWIVKIDDEFQGRGLACFSTENCSVLKDIKNNTQDRHKKSTQSELELWLRKFLPVHLQISSQKIYRNYREYKEALLFCGGSIEAQPKHNSKSIAIVCFIDPSGELSIIADYEKVLLNKITIGYKLPQEQIHIKKQAYIGKKCCSRLYEKGVFGYVTIDMLVLHKGSSNQFQIFINGIKCYYDDFIAANEQYQLLKGFENSQNTPREQLNALIVPYIDNIGISDTVTFYKFFEQCRKYFVQYDFDRKQGTVFFFMDELCCGSFGFMILDYDFVNIIKYTSKTLTFIGELISTDKFEEDRKHMITIDMVADRLYGFQKQYS